MKLKIEKNAFLAGMQIVQNGVSLRSTLPILSNVLLTASKENLSLTTTDLDLSVRCSMKADIGKTGASTLPARRLLSIIRELPESALEMQVDDKDVAEITCGSSFFKIIGIRDDEFPAFPKADDKRTYRLTQGAFKEMLRKTSYAASSDETRYVLNGVLLSFRGNKLIVVATDGRRLAFAEQELDVPKEAEADMILPTKTVGQLMHTLGDEGELSIHGMQNQIIFDFNDIQVASKLIEGTYPNYKQVIPGECDERIAVERESLLSALRRVSQIATDKSNAVKLIFGKNKLVVASVTPDVGEAQDSIPVKYAGKQITVAFNPEFVMDPLKNLTNDEVFFELTDELSPGVIKCDMPFLYVLMPMRVS